MTDIRYDIQHFDNFLLISAYKMNESLEWQKCDEKILMLNKNDKLCLTMEVKQTKAIQVL
jgi:hypothetical protein